MAVGFPEAQRISLHIYLLTLSVFSSVTLSRCFEHQLDPLSVGQEYWSKGSPLVDTVYYWSPPGHRAIDLHPLAVTFHLITYPLNSPSFKSLQLRHKDVAQDHVKDLAEVQVDDVSCPSFVH